ncbi:unnamed protein product [Trichogramma brassicae]|uniref:Integrase catalytic domain-containing protein n=1 Tax=Trichogramma brassicae TaxID=86971 RepID=A0A6H5IWT9_9HYME|nr:unnamed protein product [Trichogramma brassicae]
MCHRAYYGVILAGDFNVDLLSDEYKTTHYWRLVSEASLDFVPFGATRHGLTFDTAIDHIIVDPLDKVIASVKSPTPFTASHDSIMVKYALTAPLPLGSVGKYRNRRCLAAPGFALELQSALTSVHERSDLNEIVDPLQSGMQGGRYVQASPLCASVISRCPIRCAEICVIWIPPVWVGFDLLFSVPRCHADRPKREPSQASHRCSVRCPHELQSLGPVQSSGHLTKSVPVQEPSSRTAPQQTSSTSLPTEQPNSPAPTSLPAEQPNSPAADELNQPDSRTAEQPHTDEPASRAAEQPRSPLLHHRYFCHRPNHVSLYNCSWNPMVPTTTASITGASASATLVSTTTQLQRRVGHSNARLIAYASIAASSARRPQPRAAHISSAKHKPCTRPRAATCCVIAIFWRQDGLLATHTANGSHLWSRGIVKVHGRLFRRAASPHSRAPHSSLHGAAHRGRAKQRSRLRFKLHDDSASLRVSPSLSVHDASRQRSSKLRGSNSRNGAKRARVGRCLGVAHSYRFQEISRFSHVHIDIVTLSESEGYTYALPMIDRYARWPEAVPIKNLQASTVARAFIDTWVSCYGAPAVITSDQGAQFEYDIFKQLCILLGTHYIHTTPYNPRSNGLIERWHRDFKAALMCFENSNSWTHSLPFVMLGLRTRIRSDIDASPSEIVFGSSFRLPGEFFSSQDAERDRKIFKSKFRAYMASIKPAHTSHHSKTTPFLHKELPTCTQRERVAPNVAGACGTYDLDSRVRLRTGLIVGTREAVSRAGSPRVDLCAATDCRLTLACRVHGPTARAGREAILGQGDDKRPATARACATNIARSRTNTDINGKLYTYKKTTTPALGHELATKFFWDLLAASWRVKYPPITLRPKLRRIPARWSPKARTPSADVGQRSASFRRKSANTRKSTDPSAPRWYPKGWSPISELLVLALTDGVFFTHHGGSQKKREGLARWQIKKRGKFFPDSWDGVGPTSSTSAIGCWSTPSMTARRPTASQRVSSKDLCLASLFGTPCTTRSLNSGFPEQCPIFDKKLEDVKADADDAIRLMRGRFAEVISSKMIMDTVYPVTAHGPNEAEAYR